MGCVAFIVLFIAFEAVVLTDAAIHYYSIYVEVKHIPISQLIIYIVRHITYWVGVILTVTYVTLLWSAKVRFGTINKCLR